MSPVLPRPQQQHAQRQRHDDGGRRHRRVHRQQQLALVAAAQRVLIADPHPGQAGLARAGHVHVDVVQPGPQEFTRHGGQQQPVGASRRVRQRLADAVSDDMAIDGDAGVRKHPWQVDGGAPGRLAQLDVQPVVRAQHRAQVARSGVDGVGQHHRAGGFARQLTLRLLQLLRWRCWAVQASTPLKAPAPATAAPTRKAAQQAGRP